MRINHPYLFLILIFHSIFSYAQAQSYDEKDLQHDIKQILSSSNLQHTGASVKIISLSENKTLFDVNSNIFLRPASNTKLFTSSAAILLLDSTCAFETSVYGQQTSQTEDAWDIFIKGGADPLFTIKDIQKLVENISYTGIKRIATISLDETIIDTIRFGKGWMWDDDPEAFQPFLSAFPIEHNTINVHVSANKKSISHSLSPDLSMIIVNSTAIIGHKDSIVITRLPNSHIISISGMLMNGHSDSAELSMWNTPEIFHTIFLEECRKQGISVSNKNINHAIVPANVKMISSITRGIDEVLQFMNKKSDNLCAELVLKYFSHAITNQSGSITDGIHRMRFALVKVNIDTSAIALVDGSGISFLNLTTTNSITELLQRMWQSKHFERFKKTLAIGSTDGTLKNRFKENQNGRFVYAKTGTLSGISNLSGYVIPPNGIPICFSIFIQNFVGSAAPYRHIQDEIVSHLVKYSIAAKQVMHSR